MRRIELKLKALFGRDRDHEPPQITRCFAHHQSPAPAVFLPRMLRRRYHAGEFYVPHMDASDHMRPDKMETRVDNRKATVLTYLNDVPVGGHTSFPLLRLSVAPARGTALIFFPSFADGYLDKRALHQAEAAVHEKWVMQLWVH